MISVVVRNPTKNNVADSRQSSVFCVEVYIAHIPTYSYVERNVLVLSKRKNLYIQLNVFIKAVGNELQLHAFVHLYTACVICSGIQALLYYESI